MCLETNVLGNQSENISLTKLLICSKSWHWFLELIAAYHTDNFLPFLSPRIYIKIKLTSAFSSVCVDCSNGTQNTTPKYDPFPQYFPQCQTLNIALLYSQVSNDTQSLGQTWEDSEQHFHQVRWLAFDEGPGRGHSVRWAMEKNPDCW